MLPLTPTIAAFKNQLSTRISLQNISIYLRILFSCKSNDIGRNQTLNDDGQHVISRKIDPGDTLQWKISQYNQAQNYKL